jgi:prephenate dehydrogenase
MDTVAIVGVGLIGGSFGLALRRVGFTGRILGVSRPEAIEKAIAAGAIDSGATLEDAVSQADLVYLSQTISCILDVLPRLPPLLRPQALVTDAGSTKAVIGATAERSLAPLQFLGGHPLAGKETRGVESAAADLFEGRTYVLTPSSHAVLESVAAMEFTSWLKRIGAVTLIMTAADHDRTLAYTSHLPQLASTALAVLLSQADNRVGDAFGPALIDSTRLALSPFEIWADILKTNSLEVERALDGYLAALQQVKASLKTDGLAELFSIGAEVAGQIRRRKTN